MKWLIAAALALGACACPSKKTEAPATVGSGSGHSITGTGSAASGCEGMRAKVEGLYRAEAQAKEPARVEDAVADNTAMVMADCAKSPDKVSACVAAADSVKTIETTCLIPLDDEGTEGEARKAKP